MTQFNYKNRNLLSGPHLLGVLLIIAGLFALSSPLFMLVGGSSERVFGVGIGAILIGIGIVTSYEGTKIDFSKKRLKEYLSICGYKRGEWSDLAEIMKISIASKNYRTSNTPNGISPTISGISTHYEMLLSTSSHEYRFLYQNETKAIKDAKKLASGLNVSLDINSF
ncbi:hypothetical protein [Ekhidna sp.]